MTESPCKQLEDYLDGVLSPSDNSQFEGHLRVCDTCREAVQFDRAISEAARAAVEHTAVPQEIMTHTRRALRRWQVRRRVYWCLGLAGAIMIGCFFAYQLGLGNKPRAPANIAHENPPTHPVDPYSQRNDIADFQIPNVAKDTNKAAIVRVRSEQPARHIAVSLPAKSDNVTFVMFYPTIERSPNEPDDKPIEDQNPVTDSINLDKGTRP